MDAAIIRSLLNCNLTDMELRPVRLEDLRVSRVAGPILHIFFPSFTEKKLIVENGPWCYDSQLLVMKDWVRGEDPLTLHFDESVFWMHFRGLKAKFFTWDVASKLENAFPGRMIQFQTDDEVAAGYLAYERLPNLCFKCGRLGHLVRGSDPKKVRVYDLWIKAPLEKSWVIFRLNDEPDEGSLDRANEHHPVDSAIIEIGGTPLAQTKEIVGLTDDKETHLIHTLAYSEGTITMGSSEEQLKHGQEEDAHKGGNKEMRFPLLKRTTSSKTTEALSFFGFQTTKTEEDKMRKGTMGMVVNPKKRHHPYQRLGGLMARNKKPSLFIVGLEASNSNPIVGLEASNSDTKMAKAEDQPLRSQ
ncbi:hypothetical protein LIER_05366 [Lithospermum erythrorhizon]|uniref:Uncharacterized protein n=1 Tax=Lithospermum erythrorhizon TaxID=34254 RepID=A0AAV3P4C8_LITER